MYHIFLALITFILFSGCSTKKSYILYSDKTPIINHTLNQSIGITSIKLPAYLQHKKIPYLSHNNEILYLENKRWVSYLEDQLTSRLVNTFQKALSTSKVYHYPHNTDTKTDIVLHITIHKFIADHDSVDLEASWQNNNYSERFTTQVPIHREEDVIRGMNQAFEALESALLRSLQ
ncbi:MAG: PqiC family protein [Epsilonproteobacteria bacterium]|nr:PqiC family protein [Campylobacterota bacterium]